MKDFRATAVLSLFLFASCSSNQSAPAQSETAWQTVMVKDTSDDEATAIGSPDVAKNGSSFVMAYAQGCRSESSPTQARSHRGKIGIACSADGIDWEKQGRILSPAAEGQWDDWFLDTPCILIKDGKAWLYYFGDTDNEASGGSIGLAVSADLSVWTRVGSAPVLSLGAGDAWDSNWIESPTVQYDENTKLFHMWYTGVDKNWIVRTGHAVSPDGVAWTKDPANPVLRERNADFSDRAVWDGSGAGVASSVLRDGKFYLFYASQSVGDTLSNRRNPSIGLAVSGDGTSFVRYSDQPVLERSAVGSPANGPYNPSVLYDNGVWKIWYEKSDGFALAAVSLK